MYVFLYSSVESTSPSLLTTDNTLERSFFIRMKSTLTKRGVHIKSSGYKVSWVPAGVRLLSRVHPRSFAFCMSQLLRVHMINTCDSEQHTGFFVIFLSQGRGLIISHVLTSDSSGSLNASTECLFLKHVLIMHQVLSTC